MQIICCIFAKLLMKKNGDEENFHFNYIDYFNDIV